MPIKSRFIPEYDLLIEILSGKIDIEVISQYHRELRELNLYPKVRRTVSISNEAELMLTIESLPEFVTLMKETVRDKVFVWSLVVSSIHETVLGMVLNEDPFFKGNILVCSTLESAAYFLNIPVEKLECLLPIVDSRF